MFEKAACPTKIFVGNKKRIILQKYLRGNRKGVVDD